MAAVARRFVELGVAPRLAVELTTQINTGVTNKRRLIELGVMEVAASIIIAGITAGTLNRGRLVEAGIIPRVAKEIMASLGGGVTPVTPVAPTYEAGAVSLFNAMAADATPMPDRRKYFFNRHAFKRLGAATLAKIAGIWILGGQTGHSIAADKYNLVNPAGPKLTTAGSPTRQARGWSYPTTADVWDSGIPQNSLTATAGLLVYQESVVTASNNAAMGVQDGSAGISLVTRQTTTANTPLIRAQGAAVGGTPTFAADRPTGIYFNGTGLTGFQRIDNSTVEAYHNGELIGTYASAYVAPTSGATIKLGGDGVTVSPSVHSAYVIIKQALTQAEHRLLHACIRSLLEKMWWGEPICYDVGVGLPVVTVDVLVTGVSSGSFATARRIAKRGYSVAAAGDHFDYGPGQIGAMGGGGLAYIDIQDKALIKGYYRAIEDHIKVDQQGGAFTPSDPQQARSYAPHYWHNAVCSSLDSTRTPSSVKGYDIPVYFTQGIQSIGPKIAGRRLVTMVDGRVFNVRRVSGNDYLGHTLRVSGVSQIKGMEASGTGAEAQAGFRTDNLVPPTRGDTSYAFTIDPYKTPGQSASGLIYPLRALPDLAAGAADPTQLQSNTFRVTRTTALTRWGSWDVRMPPNYDETMYELPLRIMAANVAAGNGGIPLNGTFFQVGPLNDGTTFDFNNGLNFDTTNPTGSGDLLAQANTYAAEQQVVATMRTYVWGLFYCLKKSTDTRIQASIRSGLTDLGQYVADATEFCDPGDDTYINFPTRPYFREPKVRLRRSGYLFSAADAQQADGNTLRLGLNTATTASYFIDRHKPRVTAADIGSGPQVVYQRITANSTPVAGGTDQRIPIPVEIMMPDVSEATDMIFPMAPSITALAWGALRMEPALTVFCEAAGEVIAMSLDNDTPVQNFDGTVFRNRMLDTVYADGYPPVLPQST